MDKVIVYTAFTSTTTSKDVANSFASSVMLTLHTQNGNSISPLSAFPHEK